MLETIFLALNALLLLFDVMGHATPSRLTTGPADPPAVQADCPGTAIWSVDAGACVTKVTTPARISPP